MPIPDSIPFDDTEWVHVPNPGQSLVFFDNGPHKQMQANFATLSALGPQQLVECGFTTLQLRQILAFTDEATAMVTAALKLMEGP